MRSTTTLSLALAMTILPAACSPPARSVPVAAADDTPPPAYDPPSSSPAPNPKPVTVHVPREGDVDPAHTPQTTIFPTTRSSPAPLKPIHTVPLPKTHVPGAPPWLCIGRDECYFPRMPIYAQTNPNFAFVDVPKAIYDGDPGKLTGPTTWDAQAKHRAIILDPTGAKTLDPYYMSWLPWGPVSAQDDGYIGYFCTAICGPTAQSMAIMAALEAKSPATKLRKGSWLEAAFVGARKPEVQRALPAPLHRDHSTLAPDHRQMTAEEIQRVINTGIREKTAPASGGSINVMMSLADEFEPVNGRSPVQTHEVLHVTTQLLTDAVRERFAVVICIGGYKAALAPVMTGTTLTKYTLTLTGGCGHFMAINGFSGGGPGEKLQFLVYDPVYGNAVHKTINDVHETGATKDGVPIEVSFGGSDMSPDTFATIDDDNPAPASLSDIADGQQFTVVQLFHALRID